MSESNYDSLTTYLENEIDNGAKIDFSMYMKQLVNQTDKIVYEALKQNGLLLKYVHQQTEHICFLAVSQNCEALQYVLYPSDRIYKKALYTDYTMLKYIYNQTNYICKYALTVNGLALEYVNVQTDELCLMAVREHGMALKYVKNQTEYICIEAIKERIHAIEFVKQLTFNICLVLVKINGRYLEKCGIFRSNPIICLKAVKNLPISLQYVPYQHMEIQEICLKAVQQQGATISYLPYNGATYKICLEAVKQNGLALEYIRHMNENINICLEAVKQNCIAYQYISINIRNSLDIVNETIKNGIKNKNLYTNFWHGYEQSNVYKLIGNKSINKYNINILIDSCIGLKGVNLPSYVLNDVIDGLLIYSTITHYIKIHLIIKINEKC